MILKWEDETETEIEWREHHELMKDRKRPKEIVMDVLELYEVIECNEAVEIEKNKSYINHVFNGLAKGAKITLMRKDR